MSYMMQGAMTMSRRRPSPHDPPPLALEVILLHDDGSDTEHVSTSNLQLEALYRANYSRLVHIARLMVGSTAVGEEIVQEAFVKVHRVIQRKGEKLENPPAFVRTVVVNLCRNEHRRKVVERKYAPKLRTDGITHVAPGDEMRDALLKLGSRRRAVVVLKYYEDLSENEIAEAMGMPVGTVKSTLHRGLNDLRAALRDTPGGL